MIPIPSHLQSCTRIQKALESNNQVQLDLEYKCSCGGTDFSIETTKEFKLIDGKMKPIVSKYNN